MSSFKLKELFADPRKILVTAHRGFSGRYPENTLTAIDQALRIGADLIEFDLRGTRDHIPVLLHDPTLDRTSNAVGSPNARTLAELQRYNFSYWQGAHDKGHRLAEPALPDVTIPTFQQVLDLMGDQAGLNIHVNETGAPLLAEICRLYDTYDLYEQGYFTMNSFREAALVRAINPRIEICALEKRHMQLESLRIHQALGYWYLSPLSEDINPQSCQAAREMGLYPSMFYSNTDQDNRTYIRRGAQCITTDFPDILIQTGEALGLH